MTEGPADEYSLDIGDLELLKLYPPSISWHLRALVGGDLPTGWHSSSESGTSPKDEREFFGRLNESIRLCLKAYRGINVRHRAALGILYACCARQSPFGLYLRDFGAGKNALWIGSDKTPTGPHDETSWLELMTFSDVYVQQAVLLALAEIGPPILGIQDFRSVDHHNASPHKVVLPALTLQESVWMSAVERLIDSSGLIVVLLRNLGPGTRMELEAIRRCGKADHTIVIRDVAGPDNLDFAHQLFGKNVVAQEECVRNAPPICINDLDSVVAGFPHVVSLHPNAIEENAHVIRSLAKTIRLGSPGIEFKDLRNSLGQFGIAHMIGPAFVSKCEREAQKITNVLTRDLSTLSGWQRICASYQMTGLLLARDRIGEIPGYLLWLACHFYRLGWGELVIDLREIIRQLFLDLYECSEAEADQIVQRSFEEVGISQNSISG